MYFTTEKEIDGKINDGIILLSKGSPHASLALTSIRKQVNFDEKKDFLTFLRSLKENGIVGRKIWVGYNDICVRDEEIFYEKVMESPRTFVNRIEEEM